ncbi:hypothetical protein Acsp06_14940 [Actinomycetospora sp. NBRC 106375]|uniref:DUF2252 domain-containing protein n=1 Tax=Actinomycetospora sp. NBRC 106375 TaxID=3032207 RepID=UPI0024A4F874|nr:DUF2252 domain-containing protein [Actinomycetospora sp. NBRC 106375]GLZ45309.1 hypothetical protein Acsp06_14940 [Actinomycetospora sp. NBRC 106375]
MDDLAGALGARDDEERTTVIVETLADAFADLMAASPAGFRTKFRKMAADAFAFYRGSACLFYADLADRDDPWVDERTRRVWIQGDLHAENFGTYLDGDGVLVFDVNDFDEAYLGPWTWDLRRLVASVALLGWSKAFSDADIDALNAAYLRAYLAAVRSFAGGSAEREFALTRHNTDGPIRAALQRSRERSRRALLDDLTEIEGEDRVFRLGPGVRRLDDAERAEVVAAYEAYLDTIPPAKRWPAQAYTVHDVVGRSGFGIGSAGLPAYNVLIEGPTEALDNDIVLSMKQAVRAAPSRAVDDPEIASSFRHHGHRTALSRRALQAHADRLLGWTVLGGTGYVVSELSPYENDLDWDDLTEPRELRDVLVQLGRATARAHCVSDADSEQALVAGQVEDAVLAVVGDREDAFVADLVAFGRDYAGVVRDDHRRFVEAFRADRVPGVSSAEESL